MKYLNLTTAFWVKQIQLLLNFLVIILASATFLYATTYVCSMGVERTFIEQLTTLPTNPMTQFLKIVAGYIVLVGMVHYSGFHSLKHEGSSFFWLEAFVCVWLAYLTHFSFNGMVFIALADHLYYTKDMKNWTLIIFVYLVLFILTSQNVIGLIYPVLSFDTYVSFLPFSLQKIILVGKQIFETGNLVLFGIYGLCLLLAKEREREEIERELKRLEQVNVQMGHAITLTRKTAEDNERKRISREIHDTLGHALTGILAGVDACQVLIDLDVEKTKQQLGIISNVVRQGIKDVRGSLQKLRPGVLESDPLKDALEKMILEFKNVSNIDILFYYEWEKADFDKASEDIIYRIVQESITNALRHGHATKVEVNLFDDEYNYLITIQDNGMGCSDIKYGYGLKQMQERVAILNGKINFYGENGFLTVVEIRKVGNI
ncbi:MAG: histidine kinase [Bacillota bacterium]|nr:histidine kinase [Bacillota bacterium]